VETEHAADVLTLDELGELARAPAFADASPLGERLWLGVALDHAPGVDAEEFTLLAGWLRRQPCPVIALGGTDHPLRPAFDLALASADEAAPLLSNIRHAPLAAMVLVQLLRITEGLPVAAALTVESLAYATLQGGPEFRRWLQAQTPHAMDRPREDGPPVLIARDGDQVAIRLNRPAQRNSLSVEMRDALCEAFELVEADPAIRVARVSGNGPCFSAGGDLGEFGSVTDPATAHAVRSLRLPAAILARCAGRVEFHLHGACIGAGIELPAFGRRITAARGAFFQLPEIRFGLLPGAGGCVSIPRRIGRQRAAWMALSGERVDVGRAQAWGLVDEIVD
jgi:hypothetical protein